MESCVFDIAINLFYCCKTPSTGEYRPLKAIMHVPSTFLLAALLPLVTGAPAPNPETVGADGECMDPVITVSSVNKVSLGPNLVSGARVDANPGGGNTLFRFFPIQSFYSR